MATSNDGRLGDAVVLGAGGAEVHGQISQQGTFTGIIIQSLDDSRIHGANNSVTASRQ